MPDNIVKWVRSFMSERTVELEVEGDLGTPIIYKSGLPQGSPASPVLFNILMSDLGKFVEHKMSQTTIRESTPPPNWVPGANRCTDERNMHLS
jgi:hypothetical protein